MKKKLTLLLVIFININYFCFAQAPEGNSKKAETALNAYLTKELALTPEEAEKFWPIYNSYSNEIRSAIKDYGNDQLKLEEKLLGIRKKYKNDFKKVLGTDERVNNVFVSEKKFKEMLKEELRERNKSGEPE